MDLSGTSGFPIWSSHLGAWLEQLEPVAATVSRVIHSHRGPRVSHNISLSLRCCHTVQFLLDLTPGLTQHAPPCLVHHFISSTFLHGPCWSISQLLNPQSRDWGDHHGSIFPFDCHITLVINHFLSCFITHIREFDISTLNIHKSECDTFVKETNLTN